MDLVTGHSYSKDPSVIVDEATADFSDNPGTILYFSPSSVFEELTAQLSQKYPNVPSYGATTSYSFFEGRRCTEEYGIGTVIVAFGDSFECSGGVIEEILMHPIEFAPVIERSMNEVEQENTVCLTLTTAFFGAEELVLDTLASVIGDRPIHVAGSSCGNETNDRITYVACNGTVYSSASVFLFIHNKCGRVEVIKQDMFVPMRTEFRATSVDVRKRIIHELDGKPAAVQMAKNLHYELYELNEHLLDYGLGRRVGDVVYTTEIMGITRNKGLEMLAGVYGGTRLCLLERGKHDSCLADMVAAVRQRIPQPRFMLYINCISLTKYYKEINWTSVFCAGLGTLAPQFAGISGYGEQLDRININKTLLGIAFE
ncbi:MAG: hypothetical protein J6Y89_06265 [Lachnospiraceae bacterium]|nr:hypothetical protein [Lachnospiraceae bacterium]